MAHTDTRVLRDEDGRVVEREIVVERREKRGGFMLGMVFSLLVIAVAVFAFAYSQGSFQQAGVKADQAAAQIEEQASTATVQAGNALEQAGDNAQDAANDIAN